ncbi:MULTISPECIES: peptide chain release factor N(5)-glutamine methyltransferase [unclassified Acinetobacter]|jgi:release factor glutamine methyltransferase|uniref:peptide chain release factor N(5)-glutamine methyltransferase n=1 Tax=unclassified Acinetobacter TaxID=196816 RepID=UPI000A34E661|nr:MULTISPECIES: peptide chain release factor N(5)-glutamine methyltransferase [unclassified Acinetobacter]MDN5512838.1 peptide chain release factor N(5)-glutamine methyltransferase [Acinetobacter sp.]MDN5525286.1 peptide chain release factor N(5)-glutamine methyltransferase [Acinetobacter sp.]OTG62777.1 protein-(glutamine-N5) methyltransferase, release factor-specific [Acinetobacter sp. ANC 3903]
MNILQALALRGEPESYERQENAWLLEHITKIDSFDLIMKKDQELTAEQEHAYIDGLNRIEDGEPLAYVTGSQPFWTLDLKVTKDTLVPRPDTEVLVETVLRLELPEDARILDMGTGTGAIALSLASEHPEWAVTATDIYAPTLEVAQFNAEKHDLAQVKFALGSWFKALEKNQFFDVIVSNPPYIDPQDKHMKDLGSEPRRALVAGNNGLADIEFIIQNGKKWLTANGWVALEHGYDQAGVVYQLFKKYGYKDIQTIKDYGGNNRVTIGCSK